MTPTGMDDAAFKACCAATYGSDLASLVMGPNFHPGGRELTRRLARMACVRPGERVLDIASGRGACTWPALDATGPTGSVLADSVYPY